MIRQIISDHVSNLSISKTEMFPMCNAFYFQNIISQHKLHC